MSADQLCYIGPILLTTILKANRLIMDANDVCIGIHSGRCHVYFHGKPPGLVMTNLRPSMLMVSPELASRNTSVGIPVTLYLSASFSYTAAHKM